MADRPVSDRLRGQQRPERPLAVDLTLLTLGRLPADAAPGASETEVEAETGAGDAGGDGSDDGEPA